MPAGFVETALPVQITTPLGASKLLVHALSGEESVSGLFYYEAQLYSEDPALDFSGIVGKAVTLSIGMSSGDSQYVNGIVSRFRQSGRDSRFVYYTAEIRPWLWMLTLNSDCRIFQNQTAPDIVKKVFSDLGFTSFKDSLTRTYRSRDYCVQYRETAFQFVSRLMEEEGIFYFFTHDASSHTLVLGDDASSWADAAGLTSAAYGGSPAGWDSDQVIFECDIEQTVTPGQYKINDYNFETPSTALLATASGADTARSLYDYPGLYGAQSDGETLSSQRLSAFEAEAKTIRGRSSCRSFHAGTKFTLSGHYRTDANSQYVVRHMTVEADQEHYRNSFLAFPSSLTFRPPMTTPRPVIAGTQTATVTGPSGEEIYTDQYGRVKAQFHWDLVGTKDEKSSCWMRVAHGWAGKAWGSVFIPRIGQEVVVSFLEGNPDRPLVTGCVYNSEFTTPYTLPDDQTKSTIKSNSSKGGSGFNEFRFEDKAGAEEIFLQAQKDMNVSVLNNETKTVTKDRTLTVSGNEKTTVSGTRSISVTGDETHSNSANFTLKVSGNLSIEASGSVSIKAGTTFATKAGTEMTAEGATISSKASASQTVDGGGMLNLKGGLIKLN